MAVNWNLFTPADTSSAYDEGWNSGKKLVEDYKLKSALAAFAKDPTNPEVQNALAAASPEFALKLGEHQWKIRAEEAERAKIAALYQGGPEGLARGGYVDEAKKVTDYHSARDKAVAEQAARVAPHAYEALKLPYEQRKAFLLSRKQALNDAGFDDQEIAAFDPTDENINGIISNAQTLQQAQGRDKWTWVTDASGAQFAVDANGRRVDPAIAGAPPQQQPQQQRPPGGSAFGAVPSDPSISYGNPEDTPEQAEIRRLAMEAASQPGADVAAIWADAANDGVYP